MSRTGRLQGNGARRRDVTARARRGAIVAALAGCSLALHGAGAFAAAPTPPPNDTLDNAQTITALPATLDGTTIGATLQHNEPPAPCSPQSIHSVWYTYTSPTAQRLALNLAAGGKLDAVLTVYRGERSQVSLLQCQQTGSRGVAATSFMAAANAVYYVRVAARSGSEDGTFQLEVYAPRPAATPPGRPLPSGGVSGAVDPIQEINDAYAVSLHAGTTYKVALANETKGGCVSALLYPPGTRRFDGRSQVGTWHCTSYALFTPEPHQGGRYFFDVVPRAGDRATQKYHLEVQPVGPGDTAPGLSLPDYQSVRGAINGRADTVVQLYSFNVTAKNAQLTLSLTTASSAELDLQVRDDRGNVIGCACNATGSQKIVKRISPGHYFAVVLGRNATVASYTLLSAVRTMVMAGIAFNGSTNASAAPGASVPLVLSVSEQANGPATIDISRLDPVFGWLFYERLHVDVVNGKATVPFVAPYNGGWRANANFIGTQAFSPAKTGLAELFVAAPLTSTTSALSAPAQ